MAKKNSEVRKSAASVFKAIDNKLKLPGGGCSDSIAYMEQSSWLLFLRYLDDREAERKNEAMVLVARTRPRSRRTWRGRRGRTQSTRTATSTVTMR